MKTILFSQILLSLALAAAIPSNSNNVAERDLWQPAPGTPYQMILRKVVELPDEKALLTPDVPIWIVDLFNTYNKDPDLIRRIRDHGKKVICYFSAGTSEAFRPDFKRFNEEDIGGKVLMGDSERQGYWEGENWLDIRSPNVFKIMQERIKLAKEAGCNAIDPDNMDAWDNTYNNNGRTIADPPLTKNDSISYLQNLAAEARKHGMSIGLKNSMGILPYVENIVQFAVNEQCVEKKECSKYSKLLTKKPVFHVEYTDFAVELSKEQMCLANTADENLQNMSTIITTSALSGRGQFCDGTSFETKVTEPKENSGGGGDD